MLVTGATGFIGTWVTKKLLDLGHDVTILSRSERVEFPFDTKKIKICLGDVTDYSSVLRACENIHSVFHLAGLVGYTPKMRKQMELVNVNGTANVVKACIQSKCQKLIYMSSVVAIGASFSSAEILNEESKYNLHHLNLGYFETKHAAEKIVLEAAKNGKLHAVAINPATVYGPGDAKKGSRSIQIKVAKGKFPFYTLGGVNVVHIDDVVNAVYRAWEVGRSGEKYIIAGENIRIKELFQLIAKEAGVAPPAICLPNKVVLAIGKVGDKLELFEIKAPINSENAWSSILFHWFDNAKAKRELNLNPKPAKEAIAQSVQWMKENKII